MDAAEAQCGNVYQRKAMQYEVLADRFEPVIFDNLPFYYEMETREARCDGAHWISHPGGWLLRKNYGR